MREKWNYNGFTSFNIEKKGYPLKNIILSMFIATYFAVVYLLYFRLLIFSEVIIAFISATIFFLIPYAWGSLVEFILSYTNKGLVTNRNKKHPTKSIKMPTILRWFVGEIVLTLLISASSYLTQKYIATFSNMSLLVLSFVAFQWIRNILKKNTLKKNILTLKFSYSFYLLSAIFFGGILPFFIIRSWSVYPYQLGTDFAIYIGRAWDLYYGRTIPKSLGYFFECTLALTYYITKVNLVGVFWVSPLIVYVLLSFGVYRLIYQVTKDPLISLFSALICGWAFGGYMIVDIIQFNRRNILMITIPFIISVFFKEEENRRLPLQRKNKKLALYHIVIVTIKWIIMIIPVIILFLASNYTIYGIYSNKIPIIFQLILWPIFYLNPSDAILGGPFSKLQLWVALVYSVIAFCIVNRTVYKKLVENSAHDNIYLYWFIISIGLIMLHYEMGTALSVLLSIFIYVNIIKESMNFFNLSITVGMVLNLLILADCIAGKDILSSIRFIDIFFIATKTSAYTFPFDKKLDMFFDIYNNFFSLTLLVSFSLIPMIFSDIYGSWNSRIASLYIYFTVTLLIYFLPISYSYRFLTYLTPLFGFFSIISVYALIKVVICNIERIKLCRCNILEVYTKKIFVTKKILVHSLIWILFLSTFVYFLPNSSQNYFSYVAKNFYKKDIGASILTKYDLEAINILSQSYANNNLVIITDPNTLKFVCGLSGHTFTLNSRIILDSKSYPVFIAKESLFKAVISNFSVNTLNQLLKYFPKTNNLEIIIIVNNRTTNWIRGDPYYMMNKPFVMVPRLDKLFSTNKLKIIYKRNQQYYMFKVNIEGIERE